jgi:hypothetical protein
MGHEDQFPRPRLSVRCKFGQQTLARMQGNGQHAPIADGGDSTGRAT